MEKYGFVYIWFDKKYKRYYIGAHWGTEDDGYVSSSIWMRNSYNRRPEDFKRRILSKHFFLNETFLNEYKWLLLIKVDELGIRYYNKRICMHRKCCDQQSKTFHSAETKEKMRLSRLGKKHSNETKRKMSLSQIGKVVSVEAKEKIRQANIGRKHTEISKKKIADRIISLETKEKLRLSHMGKKHSTETKQKMANAHRKDKLK